MKKICSVRGCRRLARVKGYCHTHYWRHENGRPLEAPIARRVRGSVAKRLRAHVKIDKLTDCHLWVGHRDANGYGHMRVGPDYRSTHRLAWEVANGPIPEGMIVMHTCDNPPCCNPEHLKLGTRADNNRDRIKKGRGKGARALDLERHPRVGRESEACGRAKTGSAGQRPGRRRCLWTSQQTGFGSRGRAWLRSASRSPRYRLPAGRSGRPSP